MRERNAEFHSKQHRQRISRRAQRVDAIGFFNLLTGPELLEVTESHLPEHRERLYPPTVTLSMFMRQALDADLVLKGWKCGNNHSFRPGPPLQNVRNLRYVIAEDSATYFSLFR